MSLLGLELELNGNHNHLRVSRGDCELRIASWTVSVMWGVPASSGLYIEGNSSDRYWTWEEVRALVWAFWCR
jgi:hypothetical protein